jgi:hypothetical protein
VVKMLEAQHVDRKNEFMQIVRLGHSHCPFGASQVAEASGTQVLAIQRLSDIYDTTRLSRRKLTLREVVLSLQASRSSRCTCESCPERQHLAHSLRLRRSAFVGLLQLVRALLRDDLRRRASVRASVRRGACPHGCLCVRVPRWRVPACAATCFGGSEVSHRGCQDTGGGKARRRRNPLFEVRAMRHIFVRITGAVAQFPLSGSCRNFRKLPRRSRIQSRPWQALHGTALLRMCAVRAAHADRTFVVVGGVGAVTKPVLIARLTACASYA